MIFSQSGLFPSIAKVLKTKLHWATCTCCQKIKILISDWIILTKAWPLLSFACEFTRGTQQEYSSKPLKNRIALLNVFQYLNGRYQGCALRKISGSPSGSQAFYLSRPDLKVGRPNKNFGEPFGLPSIPAGVPRPLKLVARVHLIRKYFVRARILLAWWSPNSLILAFRFDKNPHVVLWNPSKFSCHSDLKPETWAMPPNCLGFKERKVKNFSRFT